MHLFENRQPVLRTNSITGIPEPHHVLRLTVDCEGPGIMIREWASDRRPRFNIYEGICSTSDEESCPVERTTNLRTTINVLSHQRDRGEREGFLIGVDLERDAIRRQAFHECFNQVPEQRLMWYVIVLQHRCYTTE